MRHYKGLNSKEVEESREKYGVNVITPPKQKSWYLLLAEKFNDPLIKILILAAIVSILINLFTSQNSIIESIGIIVAILIATTISFINEYKASREFDIINRINEESLVKVIREENGKGKVFQIFKNQVVVGDCVIVSQGDELPADGTLVDSIDLRINESSLNGESKPAKKSHIKSDDYSTTFSPNRVYRGSVVTDGEGVYIVDKVGNDTEIGRTTQQSSIDFNIKTPLQIQLEKFGKQIGVAGIAIAALTFIVLIISAITHKEILFPLFDNQNFTNNIIYIIDFFMVAVTLVVMAVPEGLPMSITLSMAYSVRKMAKSNALVRKINSCETMGAVTVICTDKTGTLTLNKMKVVHFSETLSPTMAFDIANNTTAFLNGDNVIGNQTEGALLLYLRENSFDYSSLREKGEIVKRVPFSSSIKYMATLYKAEDLRRIALKGAPEIILSACESNISASDRESVNSTIRTFQEQGLRVIAFASKEVDSSISSIENPVGKDFRFDGFVALEDPIREEVPDSMRKCIEAGISVKILTGDTTKTAINIAKRSGLWLDDDIESINSITGQEFDNLTDDEAKKRLGAIKVMSRSTPDNKMRLVTLLQQMGEVVAVTGDGTNDAPALNHANIGLSMGCGTSAAKNSSDIILLDDSFRTIVSAIQWGRCIYNNIQKFIVFQLTVNISALLTALLGPLFGIEMPLTVVQILWINLIMDTLAAIALSSDVPTDALMKEPPRDVKKSIVSSQMIKTILGYGVPFFIISFIALWAEKRYVDDGAVFSDKNLTIFFTFFIMLQLWNLVNVRVFPKNNPALKNIFKNKTFIYILLLIFILQIAIVSFGGGAMRTVPISISTWMIIILSTSLVLVIGEMIRLRNRRRE